MWAIYERELDSQLNGLTGYLYGALMLLFGGIFVMVYNLAGSADFTLVLYSMTFILLPAIPLLTMRSIAGERHQKTDLLLYSLPLSMTRIVAGKYLALVTVGAMPLCVLALYPPILNALASSGSLRMGSAYGALAGFFCLTAALAAIGLFISSLTESVALAAGGSFIVLLLLYFLTPLTGYISGSAWASLAAFTLAVIALGLICLRLTKNAIAALLLSLGAEAALVAAFGLWQERFSGLFAKVLGQLAVFDRFDPFVNQIFDVRSVVYYAAVIGVFLFLTVQTMERRRWAA